jgi:hypothetical protein
MPLGFENVANETEYLIQECKQTKEYSDGRVLVVDVISQSIQATPEMAIKDAWGVKIDDRGALTPATQEVA